MQHERGRPFFERLLEKFHDLVGVPKRRVNNQLPRGDVASSLRVRFQLRQALQRLMFTTAESAGRPEPGNVVYASAVELDASKKTRVSFRNFAHEGKAKPQLVVS